MILATFICLVGCSQTHAITPRDGSVIFIQGGPFTNLISRHTDSTLTHAAIILYDNGEPWVYEATPPRVCRTALPEYLRLLEKKSQRHEMSWFILEPRIPYSSRELSAMKRYAESQLGRPYMLRGWWKGREVRGIFCSEYVADILEQSGRINSAHIHESPGSLYIKVRDL
jgi:hypothetical protein